MEDIELTVEEAVAEYKRKLDRKRLKRQRENYEELEGEENEYIV